MSGLLLSVPRRWCQSRHSSWYCLFLPVPAWYCLFLTFLDLVLPVAGRCDKKATDNAILWRAENLRIEKKANEQQTVREGRNPLATSFRRLPIPEQAISFELRSCTTVEHWNSCFHKGRRVGKRRAAATRKQDTPGNHRMGGRERVAVSVALQARLQRDRYTETEAGDDLYLHLHSYMTDHNWVSNLK